MFKGQGHDSRAKGWPVAKGPGRAGKEAKQEPQERSMTVACSRGTGVSMQKAEIYGFGDEVCGQPHIFLLER